MKGPRDWQETVLQMQDNGATNEDVEAYLNTVIEEDEGGLKEAQ
jgi:hypothetical protein